MALAMLVFHIVYPLEKLQAVTRGVDRTGQDTVVEW